MKKLSIVLLIVLLAGCSVKSNASVEEEIMNTLSSYAAYDNIAAANHRKFYYAYYLGHDIGLIDSNQTGCVLSKDGYKMVMNINVNNIIANAYYQGEEEEDNQNIEVHTYTEEELLAMVEDGTIEDLQDSTTSDEIDEESISYDVTKEEKKNYTSYSGNYRTSDSTLPYTLYSKEEAGTYYLYFDGSIANIAAIVPAEEVDDVIFAAFHLLKSVSVNRDEILKSYSLKYDFEIMEENFRNNQSYIEHNLPSQGYLEDLMEQANN